MAGEKNNGQMFEIFTEIGIINQLSTTAINRCIPENLHLSHFSVLCHLVRLDGGQTPKEITAAFQVTKGTMTNTLKDLSDRGLIELKPHETDGRSKVVFATKSGHLFQGQAMQSLGPEMQKMVAELDVELVLKCLPALKHLREVLDVNRAAS